MDYFHGIRTKQEKTSVATPVTAGSGISFVVGTAPVHAVGGEVNKPVIAFSYGEAVAAIGYSDDWSKYSLCEVMYSHFKLYGVGPVIFVNVLDPESHSTAVKAADVNVVDGQCELPFDAIESSVVVKDQGGAAGDYAKGTDYDLIYEDDKLILEVLSGGGIAVDVLKLSLAYNTVDVTKVTDAEVIGGFNVTTKAYSGFELIDRVFPMFGIVPDVLLCPGWSQNSEVAAIMASKASGINGLFDGKALIDVDTETATHYADVPAWKTSVNAVDDDQILCYPMAKLGDRKFHMSTHLAGLMASVDIDNDNCPCESPSNKALKIDSTVNADGTEVPLDLQQANFLNSNGIVTAINFVNGFVLWGNETACFPGNTDVKDYFISVSRVFAWVSNAVILTFWSKIDGNLTPRLIGTILDSMNIWLNGLTSEEKLLGGRIEFRTEDNSDVDLLAGKASFRIYLAPASPAKEIEYILEYDAGYVSAALIA